MVVDIVIGKYGEDERGNNHGECGDDGAEHTAGDHIANVGGTVDADRAGGHLRDGNNVGEHLACDPARTHHLALDEREHGVTATEAEQPDFKVSPYEFEISFHIFSKRVNK